MHMASSTGPIHGVEPDVPLSAYTVEDLLKLWKELMRNRNYADVLKLLDGSLQGDTPSELRILEVDQVLRDKGIAQDQR